MKYLFKIASNLTLNLLFIFGLCQLPDGNLALSSTENSVISDSHLRAPNSYIFDYTLAREHNYSGLKIPVKKAFEIWSDENWFLNENLDVSGILSAYVYWEDVHGLISKVEIDNSDPIENSKIVVSVNPKKGKGNALISLHLGNNGNSNDDIIWSWHVWVTDDPSEGVEYGHGIETDINGNLFTPLYMDRNLGAVYNHILGHNWHKTIGLLYEWGRKDPIPPFSTKDFSFHELNGLIGYMRNREGIHFGNILPEIQRPFDDISSNIKFSIRNPISYLLNSDNGTWFSTQQYRIMDNPETSENETVAWDLWSDNMRGENSNASSSNQQIREDSRSYELKSPYDPCPNGWRVPSHLGRITTNNNHSPWGRKNSGANDDLNSDYNTFYPDVPNEAILDAKVYPGIGIDFTNAHNTNGDTRNIGLFPNTGYYVLYTNDGNPTVVFQDRSSESLVWTATYSLGGARHLKIISDPLRFDVSEFGLNKIFINQTTFSQEGLPVRCMRDPNINLTGNFETEYIVSPKIYFTKGLYNPNSYIIYNETELLIPVNKAFSAYENLFPEALGLLFNNLIANVYWTDNPSLIQSVTIHGNHEDARENFIRVSIQNGQKGNAVVSLHNGSIENPAYWSWHIWVPADSIKEITYVNQEILHAAYNFINATTTGNPPLTTTFMDRNLGALHDLPVEILNHPNEPILTNEVKNSGGLHYQWGRKDPIPSFRMVGGDTYEIYRGISVDSNGHVTYQVVNALDYQNQFTESYNDYKISAGVHGDDPKHIEADKIINYSTMNPLSFLHHGVTSNTDWVSGELSTAENRWGHAEKKSIYDPCPADWRVPDVFKVTENGKGSSPWYNGKKLGSNQGIPNPIGSHYGGEFFHHDNKAVGWFYNDKDYYIGNFPATGIIGRFSPSEIGGTSVNQAVTGVWTASLTQQMKGFALAMTMGVLTDSTHRLISTGNTPPSYGLNVRCAKDERRYTGDLGNDYFEMSVRDFSNPNHSGFEVFPNPVEDFLYVSDNDPYTVEIYDLQGRIVRKGIFENRKIDLSFLKPGVYIGLLTKNSITISIKIVKN